MSIVLRPGDLGCDMSGFRLDTSAKLAEFRGAGGTFVFRYSAGAASAPHHPSHARNAYKLISPTEHAHLIAEGIDVIANDEWYEGRMTEGANAGAEDGAAAYALWRECGHARGARVYCSVDQAAGSGDVAAIAAYLRAHQKAMGNGYYVADFYGGTPVIRSLISAHLAVDGWRPNAGSWSKDGLPYQPSKPRDYLGTALRATPAHIWQTGNYWFGKEADEDMILRVPVGSHFESLAGAPAVTSAPMTQASTSPHHDMPWPSTEMHHGDYFGLITGPVQSHGGANAWERPFVRAIQQQLIYLGYVPGIDDPASDWADGIFERPTEIAVSAFQHAQLPNTEFYGQVWSDDWAKLMSL